MHIVLSRQLSQPFSTYGKRYERSDRVQDNLYRFYLGEVHALSVCSYAAYESVRGRLPGVRTALAMLAPMFLLANIYTLLISGINSISPSVASRVFFAISLLGGTLFQSDYAGRYDLRVI